MTKKYADIEELKIKLCFDKRLDDMRSGDLRMVLEIINEASFLADMDMRPNGKTCDNCHYGTRKLATGCIRCYLHDCVCSKNYSCESHKYKEAI